MKKLLVWIFCFFIGCQVHAQKVQVPHFFAHSDSCASLSKVDQKIVGNITLEGNQTTKDKILFRELLFKTGDTLSSRKLCEKMVKSRHNLLNLSVFNFVYMDTIHDVVHPETIHVKVKVIERWYIWPLPIFELADRNFNSWWENKDFRRANYGIFLTYNNFRGRLEQLKVLLRAGYNQDYFIQYDIPYITSAQNIGIGFQLGHSLSREVPYTTFENRQLFYRATDGYARSEWYAKFKLSYRKGIHTYHQMSLSYEKSKYSDTLLTLNPRFMESPKGAFQMLHLNYYYKLDYRDSKPYPLNGHYLDVDFNQLGIGALPDEPAISTLKSSFDVYRPISQRWFWAASITAKISGKNFQPYFLQKALGFGNDFVRSYELYVIDGKDYALFKTNLKFALVEPKKRQLPFIPSEKFSKIHYAAYINWLFDVAYVNNPHVQAHNNFSNRPLWGTGIGLDLVTYYDLVWRFETSINQFGEGGFFIHFVAPI